MHLNKEPTFQKVVGHDSPPPKSDAHVGSQSKFLAHLRSSPKTSLTTSSGPLIALTSGKLSPTTWRSGRRFLGPFALCPTWLEGNPQGKPPNRQGSPPNVHKYREGPLSQQVVGLGCSGAWNQPNRNSRENGMEAHSPLEGL